MRIDPIQSDLSGPFRASATPRVRPAPGLEQTRDQVRRQVMAERGIDTLALYRLSSQDRIRAEIAVATETALRTRIAQRQGLAHTVDLRA